MGEVIGDGLIKLPFIAGLRAAFPDARITWCAAEGSSVYTTTLAPVVDELLTRVVLGVPRNTRLWWGFLFGRPRMAFGPMSQTQVNDAYAGVTKGNYGLVIDTQQNGARSIRAALLADRFVSAALPWRVIFGPKHWPEPLVDRLAALLDKAKPGARLRPVAVNDPRALAAAQALLPTGPAYVGFAPGAGGADKRWPLDRYLDLAERAAGQGATPVFFYGPEDADAVAQTRTRLPTALLPEWDRTDPYADVKGPLLVIAMASRLTAAVANDAGPGHMFAAAGTPLLSLQRDRRKAVKFRPASPRLEMLIAQDYGDAMDALPLDDAWAALQRLLH